jgi:hypothetical protein
MHDLKSFYAQLPRIQTSAESYSSQSHRSPESHTPRPLNKAESGHIYKMTVPFNESDLDDESSRICVDVTVEIAEWIVHHITPSFGN